MKLIHGIFVVVLYVYIYIWRRLVCCWARIVSHPRAPCVRERALEWKVAVPSASVRDSIGSRLGLAPGTPGFGDVRGPGLYVINKYENVWVLYTARKMLSSCQLTLVQKTQFYEVNWVLCKDKTNHACFLYRLFRNLPATICEGTKKHAFHRRGAQVFSAWENDAPSWRLFPGNAFYGIGELVPSHGQGQLHPWPPRAQDRANARVQLQACMPRASIRLAWHGKERTWHL